MSSHSSVVFNNSCVKIPRNPVNKQPLPVCDKKFIEKLQLHCVTPVNLEVNMKTSSSEDDKKTAKSLIDFYDSIPEYEDINHLPSNEFYKRLEYLKEKQRSYYDVLDCEIKIQSAQEHFKEEFKGKKDQFKNKEKSITSRQKPRDIIKLREYKSEDDSFSFSDKDSCMLSQRNNKKKHNKTGCIKNRKASKNSESYCYTPILTKPVFEHDFYDPKIVQTSNKKENNTYKTKEIKSEDDSLYFSEKDIYKVEKTKLDNKPIRRHEDFDSVYFSEKESLQRNDKKSYLDTPNSDKSRICQSDKEIFNLFDKTKVLNNHQTNHNDQKQSYSKTINSDSDFINNKKCYLTPKTSADSYCLYEKESTFLLNNSEKTYSNTANNNTEKCNKTKNENSVYFMDKTEDESDKKSYPRTPIPPKPKDCKLDNDSICSSDKEINIKPPSRRSVRIETPSDKTSMENTPEPDIYRPKSRMHSNVDCKMLNSFREESSPWEEDFHINFPLETRSCPNSPIKCRNSVCWKDTITIPKPFQMTVRDEENRIIDELLIHAKKPSCSERHELFRANPVPIESQIPLFDKIMANQEKRRQKVKKKCKAALQAQMRPFTFTRREEELQALTKRLSKSSPSLYSESELHIKPKRRNFKAKPVPKNLFSDYVYHKMHEDEFYRALQRKIRAEEMLRASSLPPSMAKRERGKPKPCVCPRSYRDFGLAFPCLKPTKLKNHFQTTEQEFEELKKEFLIPTPRRPQSRRKREKRLKNPASAMRSKSACQLRTTSALGSVSRSNLAAVLRIENARKRMEDDMSRRLEEAKLKDEARWREKVLRKRPVWQTLAFSHEEDLAMRLQLRKEEERLRNEEHKHRMQVMLGRVNQQPTLFERQSQVKHPKTREELIQSLYKELSAYSSAKSSTSSSEKTYTVDTKQERPRKHYSPTADDTDVDETVSEDKKSD